MKSLISKQVERFLREQKNYKRWLAVFVCLAVVVTIGTTAVLKYRGIAATTDNPDVEVHTETGEDLKKAEPEIVVIDGVQYIRHVHTEACYEEQKVFVCEEGKAEMEAGKTEGAGDADSSENKGSTGSSGDSGNKGSAGSSGDSGNKGTAGSSGDSGNTGSTGGHHHDDSCYEVTGGELACGKEEHKHGDSCYASEKTLDCGKEESDGTEGHHHSDSCYKENEDGGKELTCGKDEGDGATEGHHHSDSCYKTSRGDLTCGLEEHTHSESCYKGGERKLVCGLKEGDGAEAAPASETEEATSKPAANEEAPAKETSDTDTTEEASDTDATEKASDTDASDETTDTDTEASTEETSDADATTGTTDSDAAEGTTDTDAATEGEHIHTDECYEMQLVLICGLEEGELVCLDVSGNNPVFISGEQTVETENYIVTVSYTEEAEFVEGTELQVFEYEKDSKDYESCCAELGYQPDALLNIGFFVNGGEVEPKKPVKVKIVDKNMSDAPKYDIVHFGDDGREDIVSDGIQSGSDVETEFLLESLSPVSVRAKAVLNNDQSEMQYAPISGLIHEKKVKEHKTETTDENGNKIEKVDYYELSLNVKGAVASKEDKAKLDIVFVVDTSGSMAWNQAGEEIEWYTSDKTSRRKLVNTQIEELVTDLDDPDSGIDARYKLVTFAGEATVRNNNQWVSGSTLKNSLPGSASGGTNYEDALEKAGNAEKTKRSDAKSIVIFLTDGAPTYSKQGGNGSSTTKAMVTGAERGAAKIYSDYFFAVGFGVDMTNDYKQVGTSGKTARKILEAVAIASNAGQKAAEPAEDLSKYFNDFKANLKKIVACGVSFTDKLTDKVEIVGESGMPVESPNKNDWTVKITAGDGTDKTSEELAASGLDTGISYDKENGLRVTFKEGYELKEDYTYEVTTKIKATDEAAREYNSTKIYTDIGEDNTGESSEGKQGIFSNQEGSAKVKYSYKIGDEVKGSNTLDYPRPVIQAQKIEEPPQVDQNMSHVKYVQKVPGQDDVYDLTLNVTGRVEHEGTPGSANYDIVFVVDASGSMDEIVTVNGVNKSRMEHAKDAMKGLVNNLDKEGVVANYNIVSFGSGTEIDTVASGWENKDAALSYINNSLRTRYLFTSTNYKAGLKKAGTELDSRKNNGAEKIVIFLTDGEPDSVSDAYEGGNSLYGNCNAFYAIGFGMPQQINYTVWENKVVLGNTIKVPVTKSITAKNLLDNIGKEAVGEGGKYKSYENANELQAVFEEIKEEIVQYRCSNVVVTDTLSDWAEVVGTADGLEMLKVSVTEVGTNKVIKDKNGNAFEAQTTGDRVELKLPAQTGVTNPRMVATYDKTTKQIQLEILPKGEKAYELESGYTYNVTVRIKPTAKAYEYKANLGDIHEGELATDAPWLEDEAEYISTKKPGFFANEAAEVSYKYQNTTTTEPYKKPVIQANNAEITITKVVEGNLSEAEKADLLKNLKFALDGDEANAVSLAEENGTYSAKIKNVTPGRHTVTELWEEAAIEGYSRETTVKVDGEAVTPNWPEGTENESHKDMDVEVSVNAEAKGQIAVEFTNNYELITQTIQLLKVEENNAREKVTNDAEFATLKFTIWEGSVSDKDREGIKSGMTAEEKLTVLKPVIAKKDKVCEIEIQNGGYAKVVEGTVKDEYKESIKVVEKDGIYEFTLPVGSYIITEDGKNGEPLKSYYEMNPFEIKVNANGVETNEISGFPTDREVIFGSEGQKFKITVVNWKKQMDVLQIVKVSSDGGGILKDAVFELYKADEQGNKAGDSLATLTVGDSGKAVIEKSAEIEFKVGETYILHETKAPAGHMLPTSDFKFSIADKQGDRITSIIAGVTEGDGMKIVRISEEGGKVVEYHEPTGNEAEFDRDDNGNIVWTLAITNNTGAQLPVTGGPGTTAYTFGGLAMIIAVSLMYGLNMRRKREKGGLN